MYQNNLSAFLSGMACAVLTSDAVIFGKFPVILWIPRLLPLALEHCFYHIIKGFMGYFNIHPEHCRLRFIRIHWKNAHALQNEAEIDPTQKSDGLRQCDQASEMLSRTLTVSIRPSDCEASPFQPCSPPTLKALRLGSGFSCQGSETFFWCGSRKVLLVFLLQPIQAGKQHQSQPKPSMNPPSCGQLLPACEEAMPQPPFLMAHYGTGA